MASGLRVGVNLIWLIGALLLYLALLVLVGWASIHPYRIPLYISPAALGVPMEDQSFQTSDGVTIGGWWVPAPRRDVAAIFVHGYLMNRCEMLPEALLLWKHRIPSLSIDLRRHGRSGGSQSGLGFTERLDVQGAIKHVRKEYPNAKIILMASSMGGAACSFAVAEDPSIADIIVLDSCYSKMPHAISGWWRMIGGKPLATLFAPIPLLCWPMVGFNPYEPDVANAIAKIGEKPILFFHGRRDSIARPAEAERNFTAARGPKKIVWFERYGHSEGRWEDSQTHHENLLSFLTEHGIALDQDADAAIGA